MFEELKVAIVATVIVIAMVAGMGIYDYWDWEKHIEKTKVQVEKELGRKYQREFARKSIYCCISLALILPATFVVVVLTYEISKLCG